MAEEVASVEAHKSIQAKTSSMPQTPSFTKGVKEKLTKAQRRELQKVTGWAAEEASRVEALKSQKRLQRQEVQRLRGHLGDLKCAEKRGPCRALTLKARPISQRSADK